MTEYLPLIVVFLVVAVIVFILGALIAIAYCIRKNKKRYHMSPVHLSDTEVHRTAPLHPMDTRPAPLHPMDNRLAQLQHTSAVVPQGTSYCSPNSVYPDLPSIHNSPFSSV